MWHDLVAVQMPIVEKVLRTIAVYVLILLLFRVAGKRGLAGLNTFDMVVVFLLSNVVQNAVIGNDDSLLGGVIGAVTLVAVNAAVTRWLARDPRAARILEGTATTVVKDGRLVPGALRDLALRPSEPSGSRTATTSARSPVPAWSRTDSCWSPSRRASRAPPAVTSRICGADWRRSSGCSSPSPPTVARPADGRSGPGRTAWTSGWPISGGRPPGRGPRHGGGAQR
ncbi:hypothetical protein [Kitasatospora sp. NPDC005856]|uniref:DUF421 domain-containing protein n=1 Tax=Kitasatospora sp. NPDC005856 TaxID=3154566 RepID=UPI0033E9F32E